MEAKEEVNKELKKLNKVKVSFMNRQEVRCLFSSTF